MSAGSMGQVFAVCGSFFQYTIDEGLTTKANPIRAVKQKSNFKQRDTVMNSGKALTPLQWNYVIETAEVMAQEEPRHERTLFIVATLFSLYLRVSDLVGRDNWKPTMGSFEFDGENWWFNVVEQGREN
jgi:site-specific recombinase XerD